ncbi:MAG TPA: acyltransferase family protein [Acidimicrobiales bacterium]|jgi:peptidoglycan/LPS O-acetylase OafA/YrhL|nr:acyltransferase family protein [Acidimicrobiales bacterium]
MQTIERPDGVHTLPTHWSAAAPKWRDVPYLPGIDGLRAVAVVAVLLYHGGVSWTRGGFLGVEVFFVISGYLITLLLVAEHERTGNVSFRGFWRRRARRLLPALFALLGAVMFTWVVFVRDGLDTLKVELLAALTYTTNWLLIANDSSYFTQLDRPSPLQHLWSLAVEEQFYIVWPIVALAIFRASRARPQRAVRILLAGAAASYLLMQVMYDSTGDPSRVYFGTDTRASALLLGAALAVAWRPNPGERVESNLGLELAGLAGITVVVACLGHIGDQSAFLYRAGFFICCVATLATIAAVARPTALSRLLGVAPLVWIGTRSYGLYLWHWPVYVLTRPGEDLPGWSPNQALVLRLVITFLLAELSYRWIERPVREGALADWMVTLKGPPGPFVFHRRRVTVGSVAMATAVLVPATVVLALARPETSEIEESLRAGEAFVAQQPRRITLPSTSTPEASVPESVVRAAPRRTDPDERSVPSSATTAAERRVATTAPRDPDATALTPGTVPPTVATTVPPTTAPPLPEIPIFALGDSVMLGAAPDLAHTLGAGTLVDARVSRQFTEGIEITRFLHATGQLGEKVVVHLGNNGSIGPNRISELMAELADVDDVLFLTVRVPRGWEAPNNQLLAQEVARFPNARLIDWRAVSEGHTDWFYGDGIHLRPEGRQAYAFFVAAALNG